MAKLFKQPGEGDKREMAGRMYEACDIQIAIEKGELVTLEQVLERVKESQAGLSKLQELPQWVIGDNCCVDIEASIELCSEHQTYKICHRYDGADRAAFVKAVSSPVREAVYCQFVAESFYGESSTVLNEGIAIALIEHYQCERASPTDTAIEIDMYAERQRFCGAGYTELMNDISLRREGLAQLLKGNVDL